MVYHYMTIDGASSKDLDDGFAIQRAEDGWLVDIFIAAPALAIPFEHPQRQLAEKNAFTIYNGDIAKVSMLPEDLVINELSLLPGSTKPIVRVSMHVAKSGHVTLTSVSVESGTNTRQLAYNDVSQLIGSSDVVGVSLGHAMACARALFYRRIDDNIVILNEHEGTYVDEDGNQQMYNLRDIHGHIIVQEFMIMTNAVLTAWACDKGLPLLFRNHLPLTDAELKSLGTDIYDLYKDLDFASLKAKQTHLLGKAKYDIENKGHAGLSLDGYATFTSPLRRYPDLHNQYVLLSAIGHGDAPAPTKALAQHLNERLASIKRGDGEHYKQWAAFNAAKKLTKQKGDTLTTNQYLQIFKRHPKQFAKNMALDHLLKEQALQCLT